MPLHKFALIEGRDPQAIQQLLDVAHRAVVTAVGNARRTRVFVAISNMGNNVRLTLRRSEMSNDAYQELIQLINKKGKCFLEYTEKSYMPYQTINPSNEQRIKVFPEHTSEQLEELIVRAQSTYQIDWSQRTLAGTQDNPQKGCLDIAPKTQ